MSNSTKDLLLKIGVVFIILAGLFPFGLGLINYIRYQISYNNPDDPWTPRVAVEPAPYSLNDIRAIPDGAIIGKNIEKFGGTLADNLVGVTETGFVNIMLSGVATIVLTLFGLRKRLKWTFFLLLVIAGWGGLNDVIALLRAGAFLLPVFPVIFDTIGLLLTVPAIFFGNSESRTSQ
ncbi:hypothetical protein HYR99_18595 [Candidatus Poribacteria bacterium]|nr:hypothetical protein [Candidatus Poribacteria bacterium]